MVTYTVSREPDYHDIDLSFTKNRRSRDIASLNGTAAIVKSLENLINLNFYEKPFQPSIGSSVRKLLFDNIGQMTSIFLQNAIIEVIQNFEPRVRLTGVIVTPDPENNRYTVSIIFTIANFDQTVTVDLFLTRVR